MKNNIQIRIPKSIYKLMHEDVIREHAHAFERIGFLYTTSLLVDGNRLILAKRYVPVNDEDYIEDDSVGARINSNAIRKSMQTLLDNKEGCFHVHLHNHTGHPNPSLIDEEGIPGIVEGFGNISPKQAHGYIILSKNSMFATVKFGKEEVYRKPSKISIVGNPMKFIYPKTTKKSKLKSNDRQSFLGDDYQENFDNIKVGIIGYGGGGSHIGQQLAHLGVKNICIFDHDRIELSNLNRLVGAQMQDVKKQEFKTDIAKRVINGINPKARVEAVNDKWQNKSELLQSCDVVIGCVDSYSERNQLEAECRRYLIPYIDIGMDVKLIDDGYAMFGQVILSMPGKMCMQCTGFLSDEKLGIEAAKYGDVGSRPQVVWSNGVLASSAIGVFVNIVTGWSKKSNENVYFEYDGNLGFLREHPRVRFSSVNCEHYFMENIGKPKFIKL
jgi:hypothetical protein